MTDNQILLDMFSDGDRIAHYAEGPRRFTPGLDAAHRMNALSASGGLLANGLIFTESL